MKNLKNELKAYFAEKLIYWALCLNPESVIDLTVPSKLQEYKKPTIEPIILPGSHIEPRTEIERVIGWVKIQIAINDWEIVQDNKRSHLIQIKKIINKEPVKMSVYYKSNSKTNDLKLTISTSLKHPSKGRTQLHRKNVGKKMLIKLLKDPRSHTGAGYYKKPKIKK